MNERLEALRRRIEHEDNLINQRLSWLVASQAFLLTALAISLNATPNQSRPPMWRRTGCWWRSCRRPELLAS